MYRISIMRRHSMPPDEALVGLSNWWYRLVVLGFVTFLGGVAVFFHFMIRDGMAQSSAYLYLGLTVLASFMVLAWLNRVRRNAPRRIQDFLWRLGLYRRGGEEEPEAPPG